MKQLPLYEQIYNDIIEGIENGTYKKETDCRLKRIVGEVLCQQDNQQKSAGAAGGGGQDYPDGRKRFLCFRSRADGRGSGGGGRREKSQSSDWRDYGRLRAEFRLSPAGKPGNGMQKPGLQHGAPLLLRKYRRRNQGH